MSEEFRAGDTYQNKGEHARAGIDSFGWGNRIEVYGVTPSEAEELRDRILAALKDRDVVLEEAAKVAEEEAEACGHDDSEAGDYWIASTIARKIRNLKERV